MWLPMGLLPSYFAWVFCWNVFCGASRLGPEQKESAPPVKQNGSEPMVRLTCGAGLKTPLPVASAIALRNFVYPNRTECVYEPVWKSNPRMCTGVLLTFAKGWKLFGINPFTLRFCS